MQENHWNALNRLFDEALAHAPDERDAFLAEACKDPALRRELDSLLAAYDEADDILHQVDRLNQSQDRLSFESGAQIGPYRLFEELGIGGMGVVYRAEDIRLNRSVALKFLSPTKHSEQAHERFVGEARAASALDHPNLCTIYEIGEYEGQRFIAMAYYAGETLKTKIEQGPLPIRQALDYARQIASGLASAHDKGIIHRDIKPANVIVTPSGLLKILDFGLAKMAEETQQLTGQGTAMGTIAYMSPEQTRGDAVDTAADAWAVGVVLYEMLTGQRPFRGATQSVILNAIRHEKPAELRAMRPDLPAPVISLVGRLLDKDPTTRLASMPEVETRLGTLIDNDASGKQIGKKRARWVAATGVVLLLIATAFYPYWQRIQERRALERIPEIQALAQTGAFEAAYDVAQEIERHLDESPELSALWPVISDSLHIQTTPAGAQVTLHAYASGTEQASHLPVFIGETPIGGMRIPRGAYRIEIQKTGYAPIELTASRYLFDTFIHVEKALTPADEVPEGMVAVPGGTYRLRGWDPPSLQAIHLVDYAVDRYEVTNQEFKAFVDAGGYRDPAYWQHSIVDGNETLAWEAAMQLLVDRTGLQGPRNWQNQLPPSGEENHPVTGITWYEASAYAKWAGKRLPTIFEWQRAARADTIHPFGIILPWGSVLPNEDLTQRANFDSEGPVDATTYPFGISPYGAYNMAGNVREWAANPMGDAYATAGGSWADPVYTFGSIGQLPGLYQSADLGFRCAVTLHDEDANQGNFQLPTSPPGPSYTPVSTREFRSFLSHYQYDRPPLEPQRIDVQETADWRRETITYADASGQPLLAYLYLPRHASAPYQVMVFSPPFPVYAGWFSIADEVERYLSPHIKSGRAVLALVPPGGLERPRPEGFQAPNSSTVEFRGYITGMVAEYSRSIDYLLTREDIDPDGLIYYAASAFGLGFLMPAVDTRYAAVVLMSSGLKLSVVDRLPEVNPIHFLPQYKAPIFVMNGQFDEMDSYEANVRPFYELLPEPKRFEHVASGHVPPAELRVPILNAWLDEVVGNVR